VSSCLHLVRSVPGPG